MTEIIADPQISQTEINMIVTEEKQFYKNRGEQLGRLELTLDRGEILIKSFKKTPIRRIRRITGYLSETRNFNHAKQEELQDRVHHQHAYQ